MRQLIPAALAALALAVPATAAAHVTVQPNSAPAGGFARIDVRVPNERDDAGTVKVDVQMPPGFVFASYEPVPGWSVKITKEKLDQPIEVEGLELSEQIDRITWTGDPDRGGIIEPGQFQDFGLSVGMPDGEPGSKLTFKALQEYEGGEVVRWIGPEDADEPAPTVTLTAAASGGGHGAPGSSAGAPASAPAPAATDDDGGGSDGLAIAALVVGALGLLAGGAGLLVARRVQTRTGGSTT
jgi:periplasmic copper chaperone A